MPTLYEIGRQAEYRARRKLLCDGFHTVFRTAGSHGIVDLIAIGDTAILFVQVKATQDDHPYYVTELASLRGWPVPPNCRKQLWVWQRNLKDWLVFDA